MLRTIGWGLSIVVVGLASPALGARKSADEIVQLYARDLVASLTRPVKELKGFARIHLSPGEARRVRLRLDLRQLAFLDHDLQWVVEPGDVEIAVGGSSEDLPLRRTIRTLGEPTTVDPNSLRPTSVENTAVGVAPLG